MSSEFVEAVFSRMGESDRAWVENVLEELEMVLWDRYTINTDPRDDIDNEFVVAVYGWIERETDSYKDFVVVKFWTHNHTLSFTTSSEEYSSEIHTVLFDEDVDEHNECRRVEDVMDVSNVVTITQQQTLGELLE